MKKFKWIILGILFLLLAAFLFTACDSDNPAAEPDGFSQNTSLLIQEYWDDDFIGSIKLIVDSEDVFINGALTRFDSRGLAPVLHDDHIYLPVGLVAELVMAAVTYDTNRNTVIETDKVKIEIFMGQDTAIVNDTPEELLPVPSIMGDRVMLPLTVMKFFGFDEPLWDDELQEIVLVKAFQTHRLIVMTDGGELTETYGAVQVIEGPDHLYVLQYDSENAAREANQRFNSDPEILFCQPDAIIHTDSTRNPTTTDTLSWGVSRVGADYYTEQISGRSSRNAVVVAVLDTGIDFNHPFLAGRISDVRWNFVRGNNNPNDIEGHGTHVSGIIVDSTPPNVIIMPLKVLNDDGKGSTLDIYNAIRYAADSGADIINMSLGGHLGAATRCLLDERAIDYALSKNVTVITSAGNENGDVRNYSPAYYSRVITVAATDEYDQKADFSNFGNAVDIAAPGVDILSPIPGGYYASYDGTSMASPFVAACAALLKTTNRSLTPDDIRRILTSYADDMGSSWYFGAGIVNIVSVVPTNIGVPVSGVSLSKSSISLTVGGTEQLNASVAPNNATNKSVEWRSDAPGIATVSRDGIVTAVGPGSTVVTAITIDGNYIGKCDVTVTQANVSVTGVSLNKNNILLFPSETERLAASVAPRGATNPEVTWSSSDQSVATVSRSGEVTAVNSGNATITARTVDGGFEATCAVTVLNENEPITGLSLNKDTLSLSVGAEETLVVTVTPSYATNPRVIWRSDDRSVATVTQNGEVKAVGPGTTVITVHTFDERISSTCVITVTP